MKALSLGMGGYHTTLMGVLRGVVDYYDIGISDGWLFGGSGHAFLMNIHDELCPSGPYCWNPETFYKLVGNLGIAVEPLGFFSSRSGPSERNRIEGIVRNRIDRGVPCSLLNMENQVISGYDASHFHLQKPWPNVDLSITPSRLTVGSWKELGDEVHVDFFAYTGKAPADDATTVADSLEWASDMARNPKRHTGDHYHIGPDAYDAWIAAVRNGHGAGHGNWWNGTVWSECRRMASVYLSEVAGKYEGAISDRARELATKYGVVAKLLGKASEKGLPDEEKIQALLSAKGEEASCMDAIDELLIALRASPPMRVRQ